MTPHAADRKFFVAASLGAAIALTASAALAKGNWGLVYSEPNQGNAILGLAAIDANNAWAIGVSASGGNSSPVGLHTTNGVTWSPMTLPPGTGGILTMYTHLAFRDANTGWMHGASVKMTGQTGILWRTTDGGASWTMVFQSPQSLSQLQVTADGAVFGAGANVVQISANGSVFVEKPVQVPSGMELSGTSMLTATCGFLIATTAANSGQAGSAVLWTSSAGESWEVRGENRDFRMSKASFLTPKLGWVAGDREGKGLLAKTTDGGASWTQQAVPDHPPMAGQQSVPVTSCNDVKFFDDRRGVALCLACTADCEAGGTNPSFLTSFLRTDDGGQTWLQDPDYEPMMSAPPFGAMMKASGMFGMSFPNPNTGFLAGQNNLILIYTAATPEAPAWGASGCDPNASGAGGNGAGGSASESATSGADTGCGCRAAKPERTFVIAELGVLALIGLAHRRRCRWR